MFITNFDIATELLLLAVGMFVAMVSDNSTKLFQALITCNVMSNVIAVLFNSLGNV